MESDNVFGAEMKRRILMQKRESKFGRNSKRSKGEWQNNIENHFNRNRESKFVFKIIDNLGNIAEQRSLLTISKNMLKSVCKS